MRSYFDPFDKYIGSKLFLLACSVLTFQKNPQTKVIMKKSAILLWHNKNNKRNEINIKENYDSGVPNNVFTFSLLTLVITLMVCRLYLFAFVNNIFQLPKKEYPI